MRSALFASSRAREFSDSSERCEFINSATALLYASRVSWLPRLLICSSKDSSVDWKAVFRPFHAD